MDDSRQSISVDDEKFHSKTGELPKNPRLDCSRMQSGILDGSIEVNQPLSSSNLEGESSRLSPLSARNSIDNPLVNHSSMMPLSGVHVFSIVAYNVLAECNAGGEFGNSPWIKPEQLAVEYRHRNLMHELKFLDADIICLQEVGENYFKTLASAMKCIGYEGQYLRRKGVNIPEGEATFYKINCFEKISYKEVIFSDIAEKEINSLDLDSEIKDELRTSVASHAVMLLVKLSHRASGNILNVGNIHVAWDEFKRPDLQCVQIALAMRELADVSETMKQPSIMCGDFNCSPGTAPYQLMETNQLSEEHITALKKVVLDNTRMSPLATFWPQGFSYPKVSMKSAYATVLGNEPMTCWGLPWICALDYIWHSPENLTVKNVLETVSAKETEKGIPNAIFPSDHLSLKAEFIFN